MSENIIYKRVGDSKTETAHLIRPNHLNGAGRLTSMEVCVDTYVENLNGERTRIAVKCLRLGEGTGN